jgi:TonB family protein
MVVCCIFWFYPVIWLLDRRLIAEREHSCDERVIEVLRNSQAYASGLIKMTSIGLGLRTAGVSPMAGANLKRRIENMKNTTGKTGWGVWILLSSITALAVFLYLAAGCRPATASNLTIENPDESPLKIESAYVENILMPSKGTVEKLPRFVNPKIVLKNNSGRAIAVYELEFQKAGSDSIFLVNTQAGLAPNAVDTIDAITIERKTTNMYIAPPSSAKPTGDGERWTVHVVVMRFSDGSVLTLHTIPIPPPMNSPPLETMPVSQQLPTMQPVTVLPLPDKPLIRAGGKSMESKLIYRVAIYPPQAVKEGITGKVVLQVKIDEKGQVRNAQVIRSAHPILDEAAIAAVKQWRYSATMLNGVPVPVESTVTVEFPQK